MRLLIVCLIVAAGYWYFSGMHQQYTHPNYSQRVENNAKNMAACMEKKKYAAARTLTGMGDAEQTCAEELNLYFEDGQWHSYSDTRPR